MTSVEIVDQAQVRHDGIVVIDKSDGVWLTFCPGRFDIFAWFKWWFLPGKRSWIFLKTDGGKVRVRAVRIARAYVRVG